jgi:hypothetical protein
MAWIESHQELRGHPKLELAAELLGIPEVYLAGHLHYLWYWAMDYAQEGDITKYKSVQIAKAAGWPGDAEKFVDALENCGAEGQPGFLERSPDGRLLIHDWFEYGGKLLEVRKQNADKQRAWRNRNKKGDITPTSRTKTRNQDNVTVTLPSRNEREERRGEDSREEEITGQKRREENKEDEGPQKINASKQENPPLPPAKTIYSQSMQDRIALQGMIESSACDLKGRRLTKAELGAINRWFSEHKGRASPEIVEAAATETAKHTNGEGLVYFFKVMERMIYHPEQNQPVRKGGNGSGPNGATGKQHQPGPTRLDRALDDNVQLAKIIGSAGSSVQSPPGSGAGPPER